MAFARKINVNSRGEAHSVDEVINLGNNLSGFLFVPRSYGSCSLVLSACIPGSLDDMGNANIYINIAVLNEQKGPTFLACCLQHVLWARLPVLLEQMRHHC